MSTPSEPGFDRFAMALSDEFDLGLESPRRSDRLVEDLLLDSVGLLSVTLLLEDLAGRALPDDLLTTVLTLGDAYEWSRQFVDFPRS